MEADETHLPTDVRAALRCIGDALPMIRKILLLSLVLLRDGYITRYLCERPALDAAIDAALSAGVAVHTVVETLERKENAALSHGRIASVLMCLGGAFRSCLASG